MPEPVPISTPLSTTGGLITPTRGTITPSVPGVTTPAVPVIPAAPNRLQGKFLAHLTLFLGFLSLNLPLVLQAVNIYLPAKYAQAVGGVLTTIGTGWLAWQRYTDTQPAKSVPVNYSPGPGG